ncbi:hypothetical protein O3P69_016963 [Scylla paramamosain]|uniref:Uncharacterized protein n=1 Tax=Scylla paramamosain TaxID=85552 RepID=A0AAW0TTE2_SCYPA
MKETHFSFTGHEEAPLQRQESSNTQLSETQGPQGLCGGRGKDCSSDTVFDCCAHAHTSETGSCTLGRERAPWLMQCRPWCAGGRK